MALDVLEADLVGVAHDSGDRAAARRAEAPELKFNLMVRVLQRDDPLRRSYLQRRWHGHPTSLLLAREVRRYNFGRTAPIVLTRR